MVDQTNKIGLNRQIKFLAKVLLSGLVLFVGLIYNIQSVDRQMSYSILFNEFVDQLVPEPLDTPHPLDELELQNTINAILRPTLHEAGDTAPDDSYRDKQLERTCTLLPGYCPKILNFGIWSKKEKYIYNTLSVYFIANIDQKLDRSNSLKDVLISLELKQETAKDRGLAGHSLVRINLGKIDGIQEFVEVLTHELGHVIDLGVLEGTQTSAYDAKFTEFGELSFRSDDISLGFYELSWESEKTRKKSTNKVNFCSGYGLSNPFEDFAEHFNCYLNHNRYFFLLAQSDPVMYKKYQFFAKLFDNDYIFSPSKDLTNAKKYIADGDRPWDSTRM